MGERRRNRRWPRQLDVRVWKYGEEGQANRSISTNVSRTGIFVRTQQVLPSGTRLRLEVGHSGRSFVVEGVVMRALRTPSHLQSVMPSGMGVRFLSAEELLFELLPAIDFQAEERIPTGLDGADEMEPEAEPAPKAPPRAASPARLTTAAPTAGAGSPAPTPTTPRGVPSSALKTPPAGAPAIGSSHLFPLHFRDSEQFRMVFERDVQTGGLFISTPRPAPLDAVIQVEVIIEGMELPAVRLQARVVHRMEPPPGSPPGNLLAGMGVQFLDVARAVEQLRALLG
ncbi:MAG TPA: PilZ domain-containing protein [Thermoanaerobaculia bacterium]|jgi:hypothetical protein|nr:PilZ domain-containing protein [Thermoanaerobaculia bacterium]